MESVFLHLLNMSITAGWLVLAVVVLRLVFRRAPKWIHCLLWVLVAVRLLCPVSVESVLSLIPSAETVPVDRFLYDVPAIHSGVPAVDAVVNPIISNGFAPQPMNSVNPMQVVSILASYVWVLGMAAMVLYAVITTLRLRHRVREAAYVRDNIWQCDRIATPFILGIIRPRIYLPTLLGAEETRSVVAHEQAHLARRDHWWKPLGFLLLTVYWFNPLLWLGYVLLCRDIEAACDQRVIQNMDTEGRREYSRVLLACSAPRHLVTACPLAFGETGVRTRIKSVLNYKKPAFWLIITAVVATIMAAVCLLTNPKTTVPDDLDAFLSQAIIEHNRSEHTGEAYPTEAHTVFGSRKVFGRTTVYGMVLYEEYYVDENGDLQVQSGSHCPTILTVGKDADGNYTLLDYWIPRDGGDYARDIRNRFPARHQGKAFDTDGHYKRHHSATYAAARQHFEPWQTALSQAILTQNRIENDPAVYAAESHIVYGVETGENVVTVYALVRYQEYTLVDGTLTERSGSQVPTAVTFTKNGDTYELLQYWTPGENWADSIREKFPEYLWEKALDYANYPTAQLKEACLAKAQAYFGSKDVYSAPLTFKAMTHISGEKRDALYANVPTDKTVEYLPIIPITNRGSLDAFIEEYKEEMSFDRAEADGLTPIHQMSFYDADFFAGHVLLAVYYADGSCSVEPKIGGVTYTGGTTGLQVQVDVYEPEAGDTAVGQWFMLCEVDRSAIPDVQTYTAVVRERIPMNQPDADSNTFVGRVTQVIADGKEMLMDCYDTDKFTEVWVSLRNIPDVNPKVGEEYVVTHDGLVQETYPPQVTAVSVTPISSTPTVTKSAYWITFSHPLYVTEAASVTGGYTPHESEQKQLEEMVDRLAWQGADADTVPQGEACFSLDGKTRYYVNLENQLLFKGTQFAELTQDDVNTLDFLVREGNPTDAATHRLTGTMIEWSKAQQYILLEVTDAEITALVGKKIRVSTRLYVGGVPAVGTSVEVGYDGTVADNTVYGLVIKGLYSDQLGGPDDGNSSFVGRVIRVEKGKILMDCYDTDRFTTVWVFLPNHGDLHPAVGDEYIVLHSDFVMTTDPPQVTAESITPVSSTPTKEKSFISEKQAIDIAADYWGIPSGDRDRDPETGFNMSVYAEQTPTADHPQYCIVRQVLVPSEDDTDSVYKTSSLYIDAVTGEVIHPTVWMPDQS